MECLERFDRCGACDRALGRSGLQPPDFSVEPDTRGGRRHERLERREEVVLKRKRDRVAVEEPHGGSTSTVCGHGTKEKRDVLLRRVAPRSASQLPSRSVTLMRVDAARNLKPAAHHECGASLQC